MFEIGNSLREARSRRQIELPQAELATKIRVKYLRALEDERFEILPSQTYVKGFLRTYADYLGLDGQLYVDEFNSRYVAGEERSGDARPRRSSVRPERRTRRIETSVVLIAIALVGVVTLVVVGAWQTSGSGAKKHAAGSTTRTHKTHASTRPQPFFQVEAVNGSSYVSVHRGGPAGRPLFQGTIEKGAKEPFSGKYFWLDISQPENLVLVVGGKRHPLTGSKPSVVTVTPGGVKTG